jgi:hypothetical protein
MPGSRWMCPPIHSLPEECSGWIPLGLVVQVVI